MKKILKRKNLFITVILLCLGVFTSCTLDFAKVKSIEFTNAPASMYEQYDKEKNNLIPLSNFEVKVVFDDISEQKYKCDNTLLIITGDIYSEDGINYLDTTKTGLKKITVKYENVSIMVTFEVVKVAETVTNQAQLDSALSAKNSLIRVDGSNTQKYDPLIISYPVHIIGINNPEFNYVSINTTENKGIYQIEGIKVVNSITTAPDSSMELLNIKDNNPFAKVIINNCNFEFEKKFDSKQNSENSGAIQYDFIRINKEEVQGEQYYNIEITDNTFTTVGDTAIYSAIRVPKEDKNTYSSLFIYSNEFNISARYVLTQAFLSNLEIIDNIVKVNASNYNNILSDATGFQFAIYNDSLCNIKGNEFNMDACGEKSYALNITFKVGSENAIQKFIANLSTNKLSSKTSVNILSWIHNLKTIDFGQQNLTKEQFSISSTGKKITEIPKNMKYDSSREYFTIENGMYVKVPVENEDLKDITFAEFLEQKNITHFRINTNISWNIRFIDANGNEQFIDPFPGDEDIYIVKPAE